MQNGLDPPLRSYELRQYTHALGNLPSPHDRIIVGHPYLRQEAAGVELCQGGCVDFIRFDPGPSDRLDETRVRHNDALHIGAQKPFDGRAIASRFDHDFVVPP
ncbi:Hypothetical protein NGAL_HAMBI2566_35990 [Neorhizobium galegae bv. orientalis]|nr:Hypothetical protein NGAL_HAMBI2566_35990 [Neorhizobium galegae bv. orientalis]